MNSTTLFYIHDPMCSWCWGFSHTWNKVKNSLPSEINVQYILGGLAPDSSEVMPNEM
ncbi:MAG TPA: DsbA family protein, partial [Gammaproteobacteria bacterium]|nr:DsbA family protein [Gammaproteobacteria bacterium]